jgi:STE24 endopeptidase
MSLVMVLVIALLTARTVFQVILDLLNRRSILASARTIPEAFRGVMDEDTYNKAVAYSLAKNRLSVRETVYDALLLALFLLPLWHGMSVVAWLWEVFSGFFGRGIWGQSGTLFAVVTVLSLPSLPWEWYGQFRLEERFGFNRSTFKLWLLDKLKGMVVGLLLGLPLLALLLWLVGLTPLWWIWGFALIFLFQLVMIVVYPMFIMPLFNKFDELPEGDLRNALMALGDRTGFQAKTILVMDGSRRSAHSNAFFTGFGAFRRIVLYDTLMEQLKPEELEAVLAHEIGHYKLGHIPKMVAFSAVSLLIAFALIGWLAKSAWFAGAFGFPTEALAGLGPTLLLFSLLSGLATFWFSPLGNILSRRHEYEADHFARQALANDPQPLIGALRRLSEKNLSNLTPHPWYSGFYYSHPTLLEREASLKRPEGATA